MWGASKCDSSHYSISCINTGKPWHWVSGTLGWIRMGRDGLVPSGSIAIPCYPHYGLSRQLLMGYQWVLPDDLSPLFIPNKPGTNHQLHERQPPQIDHQSTGLSQLHGSTGLSKFLPFDPLTIHRVSRFCPPRRASAGATMMLPC